MGFFDELFGKNQPDKTQQIKKDRDKIKFDLEKNLKSAGFTKLEIKEVLDVIILAEADIQILKDSLIGTNINNPDPTPVMKKVMDEIRVRQQEMAVDIKKKIQEIKKRKEQFKKEL